MGLSFSHGDAHWSCSGFNDFRRRLAVEIHIDLDEMEGYGCMESPNGEFSIEHFKPGTKSWKDVKDDIKPFLRHSGSSGYIGHKSCAKLIPRLLELIKEWPDGWPQKLDIKAFDKQEALKLIAGMRLAVEKREKLRFL